MKRANKGKRAPVQDRVPVCDRESDVPQGLTEKQYAIWLTYRKHVHPAVLAQLLAEAA